jgi:hypothetical protein
MGCFCGGGAIHALLKIALAHNLIPFNSRTFSMR